MGGVKPMFCLKNKFVTHRTTQLFTEEHTSAIYVTSGGISTFQIWKISNSTAGIRVPQLKLLDYDQYCCNKNCVPLGFLVSFFSEYRYFHLIIVSIESVVAVWHKN